MPRAPSPTCRSSFLGLLLVLVLVVGCTSAPVPPPTPTGTIEVPNQTAKSTWAPRPVVPPAPIAPLDLTGSPEAQARRLATAFAARGPDRAAALLAAEALAGVPVIDAAGKSIASGAESIGLPWAQVWRIAGSGDGRARVSLAELATVLTADGSGTVDSAVAGRQLLEALRAGLGRPGPGPGPIAELVRVESLAAGGADLTDSASSASTVVVSVLTASVLVHAAILTTVTTPKKPLAAPAGPEGLKLPSGCAEDDGGQWALWLMSKVAAGVSVAGVGEWEGAFREVIASVERRWFVDIPMDVGRLKDRLGAAANVTEWVAAAITALGVIVALTTLNASVVLEGGEPLIRTPLRKEPGETKPILVTVGYDYDRLPSWLSSEEGVQAFNCLLAGLVLIGNNTTMPSPGPLVGAMVTIQGRAGFADRLIEKDAIVLFPEIKLRRQTGEGGQVRFPVAGRAQKRDLSDPMHPVSKTFSVALSSTAGPSNLDSIAKTFLDSFLCGTGVVSGRALACADAIGDVVQQFDWDIGTWPFKLTDWEDGAQLRYRAELTEISQNSYTHGARSGNETTTVRLTAIGLARLEPGDAPGTLSGEGSIAFSLDSAYEFTDESIGPSIHGPTCGSRSVSTMVGSTPSTMRVQNVRIPDTDAPGDVRATVDIGTPHEQVRSQVLITSGPCPSGPPITYDSSLLVGTVINAHSLRRAFDVTDWKLVPREPDGVIARKVIQTQSSTHRTLTETFEIIR